MPVNLTSETIASTFGQLLHVDGGPTAAEKVVHSGTGVATALKVGTTSASVGNVQLADNTIQATAGSLTFGSDIAFTSASNARAALGLGTMATQNAGAVAITGGSITNVALVGAFSGITSLSAAAVSTSNVAAGVSLAGNMLSAVGTDANIDVSIVPKGTGKVVAPVVQVDNLKLDGNTLSSTNADGDINLVPSGAGEVSVTNIDVLSGKVPFGVVTNRAYAAFSDTTDQTGSAGTATAVKFNTVEVVGVGATMVTDGSNMTRLTFAAAGTYRIALGLQFANSGAVEYDVAVWLALVGSDVPRSAARTTVHKVGDGGSVFLQTVFLITVAAGQYVQVMWLPENAAVTLDHTAAVAGPPAVPAIPSGAVSVERVA